MPKLTTAATADGLTPKEARFVAEYLVDGNGKRAATAAGYSAGNARKQAYQLLQRAHVRAAIDSARERTTRKLELTAEKVLTDISRVARKAEAAKEFSAALKGHQLLGMHLKLFTEKHEHGGMGGGPVLFQLTQSEADH